MKPKIARTLSDEDRIFLEDWIDLLTRKAYAFGANNGKSGGVQSFIEFGNSIRAFLNETGLDVDAAHRRWEESGDG